MSCLAASMYFDIEDKIQNNFNEMDKLARFVKEGRILIAVDSNADRRRGTTPKLTQKEENWKST